MSTLKPKDIGYLCLEPLQEGRASYTHVLEIIGCFRKNGFKVHLYHPNYKGSRHPSFLARLLKMLKVQFLLAFNLQKFQFLYSRWHPCGFIISFLAYLLNIPVIQEVNGPYQDFFISWNVPNVMKPFFNYLYRKQLDWADHIIVVTEGLRKFVSCESSNSNITVIPNGANTDLFYKRSLKPSYLPEKYVVYFGAFTHWHGIHSIIEATRDSQWPLDIKVVFIGDGVLKNDIIEGSQKSCRIVYLGKLPYEEVPSIVSHSLASLVTIENIQNRADTGLSPLKLYESLACSVPVIITNLPEQGEFVAQNNCGLVISEKDPAAIAKAVHIFSSNPEMVIDMGKNGQKIVEEEYSWDKNYERLSRVIGKLTII